MTTIYGSFPGVQVEVAGGAITAVAVGGEEKLVIFGEASYQNDTDFSPGDGNVDPLESGLTGSTNTAETINARGEADTTFGSGSELADAMREALANGANIDFLYGVAPDRYNAVAETQGSQSGTLSNAPLWEEDVSDDANISALTVTDTGGTDPDVRYAYESPPSNNGDSDTVTVNPHTGEYDSDSSPSGDYEFSYKYLDWSSAVNSSSVDEAVNEEDTALFDVMTEADSVSSTVDSTVSDLRDVYKMVNAMSGAEPNSNELIQDSNGNYQRRDARFDTATFSKGSVDSDYYFKFAPLRLKNSSKTILGGVGGLFAGNPISDPIYNDRVLGYDSLEQGFTKSDADNVRDDEVIPVRESGSIRVKDNLSTSTESDWERDFWRRRIADRVILIGKSVGDTIIGRINDEQTRNAAARLIRAEIRELVNDRLLQPNTDEEQNWYVDVYEDSQNVNEVNIDIGFTPYGIVKRVDESITINT